VLYGGTVSFDSALKPSAQSPAPVNLGTDVPCPGVGCGVGSAAGDYVILTTTGITDVPPSVITGNIGATPIGGAAIGISCGPPAEVTGTIFEADAGGPACFVEDPAGLGTAIGYITIAGSAYRDAAGRAPTFPINLDGGNLTGLTLVPGVYRWGTDVSVNAFGAVKLAGGPNDVWIFQMSGNLTLNSSATVILIGGAQANNIFWQVGGGVGATLDSASVMYGTILSAAAVVMKAGASLTGRALAGTDVTLISNTITSPGPLVGGLPPLVPPPIVQPTVPTVISTVPVKGGTAFPIASALAATFNEPMNPATINALTFSLIKGVITGGAPVAGTVTYAGVTATFTPTVQLLPLTSYTATITTGAQDLSGNALGGYYIWSFTTAATTTPPTVISTVP